VGLEHKVREIVGRVLNLEPASLRMEARLKEDLGATSLDRYTILIDIEESFGLEFDDVPEEELDQGIKTVSDIVEFLRKRLPPEQA